MEVGGGEVGAQSHVRVLQLSQDPPVELGADPVELHDVTGILLDPETVKLLHQVTCQEEKFFKLMFFNMSIIIIFMLTVDHLITCG